MNPNYSSIVKAAELRVLEAEQAQVMPGGCADWAAEAGIEPADVLVRSLSPAEAEREFLDQYQLLKSLR